jgi:hypothetical protein
MRFLVFEAHGSKNGSSFGVEKSLDDSAVLGRPQTKISIVRSDDISSGRLAARRGGFFLPRGRASPLADPGLPYERSVPSFLGGETTILEEAQRCKKLGLGITAQGESAG